MPLLPNTQLLLLFRVIRMPDSNATLISQALQCRFLLCQNRGVIRVFLKKVMHNGGLKTDCNETLLESSTEQRSAPENGFAAAQSLWRPNCPFEAYNSLVQQKIVIIYQNKPIFPLIELQSYEVITTHLKTLAHQQDAASLKVTGI